MLMGMAKPMPSFPPELLAIAVFMPITSPRKLTSGPPLLPGLIAASVCTSVRPPTVRTALTIPRVTVF